MALYADVIGGRIAAFCPDSKAASGVALPVVEDKPAARSGHEIVGPEYRIEKTRVVAYWREVPVDPLSPQELHRRLAALEAAAVAR